MRMQIPQLSTASPHRCFALACATAAVAVLSTAALATPALAARAYQCQITEKEAPAETECNGTGNTIPGGAFKAPSGLAIDASGHLWVVDRTLHRLDEFDASGNFLSQATGGGHWNKETPLESIAFGVASDSFYVADEHVAAGARVDTVWVLASDGSVLSELDGPTPPWEGASQPFAVAVDNSAGPTGGDVYVAGKVRNGNETSGPSDVFRVDSAGNPAPFAASAPYIEGNKLIAPPSRGEFSEMPGLATDSAGDIYVVDKNRGEIDEFEPSGTFRQAFAIPQSDGGQASEVFAVAIDPTNDDVLVSGLVRIEGVLHSAVYEFSPAGELIDQIDGIPSGPFAGTSLGSPHGLVVDSAGRLYLTDATHRVIAVFGLNLPSPEITNLESSPIGPTSATVHAKVDPAGAGEITTCRVDYADSEDYEPAALNPYGAGHSTACSPPTPYATSAEVETELAGLQSATVYHYRVVVNNAAGETAGTDQTFETTASVKDVQTGDAGNVSPTSATLNGSLDPAGIPTSYHFDYATEAQYDASLFAGAKLAPDPDADAGSASGTVSASTQLTGLEPGTTYVFRLVASNVVGPTTGAVRAFTTLPAVKLQTGDASDIHDESAVLNGAVDPQAQVLTDCHFSWGEDVSFGHDLPCSSIPGPGTGEIDVHAALSGLEPGRAYYYRLFATGEDGSSYGRLGVFVTASAPTSSSCSNEARREAEHATALPDCRAYEQVSPPNKNGSDIVATPNRTRAAVTGDAVQFISLGGFANSAGSSGNATDYIAIRDPSASTDWTTHAITPPNLEPGTFTGHVQQLDSRYLSFSSNLDRGVFLSNTPLTAEGPNVTQVPNLYLGSALRTLGDTSFRLLSDCVLCAEPLPATPSGLSGASERLAGTSSDLSHAIFESNAPLTPDVGSCVPVFAGSGCPVHLFEWSAGAVRDAGVLPADQGGGAGFRTQAGRGAFQDHYSPNTISQDGSHIFFTATANNNLSEQGQLYMRVDNSLPDANTVRINASERSSPDSCQAQPASCPPATYWDSSADGTRVFFTTKENLIDSDTSSENSTDLYMYDSEEPVSHRLTLLSKAEEPELGADVKGVIGASQDGAYVYFVANGQLVSGQPQTAGARIFVWHEGTVSSIGRVPEAATSFLFAGGGINGFNLNPQVARLTPDGHYLLFASAGTDELPHNGAADACIEGCTELYLYDATANDGDGKTVCASCPNPDGPASVSAGILASAGTGFAGNNPYLNHPLSADGRYVFFNTAEQLVAEDTNGVQDVYEYDSVREQLHLISGGTDEHPSYFTDASSSGADVFFATNQALSGWDGDRSRDLYDARIGGGVPGPPVALAPCSGESCRSQTTTSPSSGVTSTANFAGPANPKPRRPKVRHRKAKKHHHRRTAHHRRKGR